MRMSNVYNSGADANPNANHDPTAHPDPTLTLKVKVKVKVNVDLYSALSWTHLKALRYIRTRSQGISQFYLHTPRSSAMEWTKLDVTHKPNPNSTHSMIAQTMCKQDF